MPVSALKKKPVVRSHHKAKVVPEFEVTIPDAPEYLNAEAKKHWAKLVPDLAEAGVMTNVDIDALAIYCTDFVALIAEQQALDNEETIIEGMRGAKIRNPRIIQINHLKKSVQDLQIQFGITPKGRSGVKPIKPKGGAPNAKPANRFAAIGF